MSTYIISTRPTTMPTPGWTPRERPALQPRPLLRASPGPGKSFQRSPSTCLMNCQVSRRQKNWALSQMLTWRELRLSSHPPRTRHRHLRSSGTPRSSRSGETSPNTQWTLMQCWWIPSRPTNVSCRQLLPSPTTPTPAWPV